MTTTSTRIGKFEARLVLFLRQGRVPPGGLLTAQECCSQSVFLLPVSEESANSQSIFSETLIVSLTRLLTSCDALNLSSPRFFHLAFEEEFGRVKGHFGPINSVAFHPDGKR